MKYAVALLLLSLCLLALLFPGLALTAGREALALFFENVLPALFPFYVLTGMLCRTPFIQKLIRRPRAAALFCFLMGGLSGYPTGARLSVAMGREPLAASCNLCSPMFLLGVVSLSMYGDASLFPVLAASHYGTAAVFLLLDVLANRDQTPELPQSGRTSKGGAALLNDIGDGMLAMLRIGGSVLFFYVMAKLLCRVLPGGDTSLPAALVSGVLEMTSGCAAVAALDYPARVSAGLYAFFTSFGGFSVLAQSVMTAELKRPGRYIGLKLTQGFAAGLAAYLLSPLLLCETVAAASMTGADYKNNTLLGFAFFTAACLGLCGAYLFAHLAAGLKKRTRAQNPGSHLS